MQGSGLKGKTVLITGATGGFGLALVRRFATEGCRVFGIDRNAEGIDRSRQTLGNEFGSVTFDRLDVCDEPAVNAYVTTLPALDIVINNAAIIHFAPILETGPEVMRRLLEVNVIGAYIVLRAAATRMKSSGGGHIINIASLAAHVGMLNLSHYAASKHALMGLSRTARLELAPHHIRVSAFSPGVMATEMVGDVRHEPRCMQPDDAAEAVCLLAQAAPAIDVEEVVVRSTSWP